MLSEQHELPDNIFYILPRSTLKIMLVIAEYQILDTVNISSAK